MRAVDLELPAGRFTAREQQPPCSPCGSLDHGHFDIDGQVQVCGLDLVLALEGAPAVDDDA